MKKFCYIFVLFSLFVSCKPTATIITSKTLAKKRGIYISPKENRAPSKIKNSETISKVNEVKNAKQKTKISDKNEDDYVIQVDNSSYLVKQLINAASDNLGSRYRSGGTTPDGFDCSGLMYSTFKQFDISLPRSSVDMAKKGRKLNNDEIQKGDLIFFRTNGKSVINHVGMVTEVNDEEIKFIHSSTSSGVIISSTKESYYGRTFAQANRILE